jgi:CRP/FNR family transcriptional regulator, cyclic AMP receptor protein
MADETKEILARLPLFAGLSEASLDAVSRRTVTRRLPQAAILFRKGEPCQGLYVVLEGTIRVYRSNLEGREQVLHVQGPGQPLAEVPLFDGGPYPASARASEAARVLFLPRSEFEWLYLSHPEIADAVIRELGRRLRRMVQLVEKISLKDVPARVAMTLLEYAERLGTPRDGLEFELPRTQEELAAELATTRESVARALARLRRAGLIETAGPRIRIRNLAGLEAATFSGTEGR